MKKRNILTCLLTCFIFATQAQTTIFFQGFESATTTCTENWGYTGGNRNTETDRTGSYSARIGRQSESNTLTFNTVNVSGLAGVTLQVYHSVRSGSGPGMDTREGAIFLVSLNGGAYTAVGRVTGNGDYNYPWTATSGGIANTCPTTYTTPNPLNYAVPAGTNTISFRVISVGRNSSSCAVFNTAMTGTTAYNFDRADEGIFIDDVRLTTTTTALPGLWTGAVNTDWFNCGNWANNLIPTASSDVTIDQTASNNCVVGVSATGTAVCRNISVSSSNGTNRTLTVQNAATLTCSGNATITKTGSSSADAKIVLLNTAGFTCVNLTMTGTGSGAENAQFENETNTPTAIVQGNLVINNGGVLDLTGSGYGILQLKGNYTNNGLETDFKQSNSVVRFNGTGATQTITTTGFNEIFANVVVNKTSGVLTLNNSIEIENDITFTNGIVNTTTADLLIIQDDATATGMSNASYVDGPVRKIGNDAFTFPTGDAGNYQDISITAPSSASHHFTAQYFETDPDPLYDNTLRDPTLDHISTCEYWILNRTGGSSDVGVNLRWDASSCGVTNLSELAVARWDGSLWRDHGNGGTTGTTATGTIWTSGAVTTFSPFTLASITLNNPLPIDLLSFNAVMDNGVVHTSWITASEQNTQFHIVERSANGEVFAEAGRLHAAGFSNQAIDYRLDDHAVLDGTSYYRLKTVDFDNTVSYSEIVKVNTEGGEWMQVYYDQAGAHLVSAHDAEVTVYSASGQMIKTMVIPAMQNVLLNGFAPGIYLMVPLPGSPQQEPLKVLVH